MYNAVCFATCLVLETSLYLYSIFYLFKMEHSHGRLSSVRLAITRQDIMSEWCTLGGLTQQQTSTCSKCFDFMYL